MENGKSNGRITSLGGMEFIPANPDNYPARILDNFRSDPAAGIYGAPPGFGQTAVPHIFTVSGRYGMVASMYTNHHDEALYHDPAAARIMRNEVAIMECLEARMRSIALLPWHIQPIFPEKKKSKDINKQLLEDDMKKRLKPVESRWSSEELASKLTEILHHTPFFTKLRYSLSDALWYGRYGAEIKYGSRRIGNDYRTIIRNWSPRHGDKFVFRYDDGSRKFDPDQIGIRVGAGYAGNRMYRDFTGQEKPKIEPTTHGLVYWFDDLERKALCIHKHIIEDGDFDEPLKAGSIHGIGIRSRIFWTWWAYQQCMKLLLEYTERSALGLEIWRYPASNAEAKKASEKAARERGPGGRSILLVPVTEGEQAALFGVEIVEPGLGGLSELKDTLQTFFGHKMKRYILGQTLTSEAEATGMGSGVADAHMATFHDIVKFDALGLEETITNDILRQIQLWNFPGSENIYLKFHIDTDSDDSKEKLDSFQQAWSMGAKLKVDDLYDAIGTSKPTDDDETIQNPAFSQPSPSMMTAGPFPGNPLGGQFSNDDLDKDRFSVYSIDESSVGSPTEAQAESGNYKKAHVRLHGLDITIENPKGTRRKPDWPELNNHYGYIKGTRGRDGDHVDVFIGPQPYSELVAVIDQVTKGGKFDEHKVMLGVTSKSQAKKEYLSNYSPGWKCGPVTMMTIDQFKEWLECGDTKKRIEYQVSKFSQLS